MTQGLPLARRRAWLMRRGARCAVCGLPACVLLGDTFYCLPCVQRELRRRTQAGAGNRPPSWSS
ncbi:MAG: hypothetical protein WCD86_02120 [Ktedonobacteraceae bacterium]